MNVWLTFIFNLEVESSFRLTFFSGGGHAAMDPINMGKISLIVLLILIMILLNSAHIHGGTQYDLLNLT